MKTFYIAIFTFAILFGMQSAAKAETNQAWASALQDDAPAAVAMAGNYTGGTYANAAYFQKYAPAANQTVTISTNEDLLTVSVSYTSETWGTFTYEAVAVTAEDDGSYSLAGEGICAMPSMATGAITEYASDFTGTVADGKLVAAFAVPSVMGGTTVLFNPADIDEVVAADIHAIGTPEATDAPTYNLQGVRVDGNYKGIVVRDGKKFYQKK